MLCLDKLSFLWKPDLNPLCIECASFSLEKFSFRQGLVDHAGFPVPSSVFYSGHHTVSQQSHTALQVCAQHLVHNQATPSRLQVTPLPINSPPNRVRLYRCHPAAGTLLLYLKGNNLQKVSALAFLGGPKFLLLCLADFWPLGC